MVYDGNSFLGIITSEYTPKTTPITNISSMMLL
jgi:hypothetical protein